MRPRRDPLLHYLERPSRRRLERVVRAYHDHVWKVAFRVAGHAEDAQDICQDVFLGLLLDPPAASEVRSPGGYLAWRVVGRAGKLRRAAERRAAREREAASRMLGHEVSPDDAEVLRAELDRLPDELRLALELRYLAGLGNAEVASALGLPSRTLEQRLHDGRERLKRRLAPLLLGPPLAVSAEPAPAAPPALLPALLQVVRRGGALSSSPAALAVLTGGVVMTKKTVAVAGALAVLLLASTVGSIAVLRRSSGNRPEEVAAPLVRGTDPARPAAPVTGPVDLVEMSSPELPPEPPRASLHGVVKDEEGAVLPGVTVVFRDNVPADHAAKLKTLGYRDVPEGEWGLETTTDGNGEFHFDGLLPGEARAGAKGPGLGGRGQSDFELEAGKTTWHTLFLRYLRRLHGRVSTSDGAPLRGAAVLIRYHAVGVEHLPRAGDEDHEFVLFPADENGWFDTGHCLERFPEGGNSLVAWADGRAMNLHGKPRVSGDPYVASVDFVLEPERPLELTVRDPAGSALEGANIALGDKPGTIWGWIPYPLCSTDAGGRARVDHLERKKQVLCVTRAGFQAATLTLIEDGPREITVVLQPEAAGADLTVRLVYEEPFPSLVQLWGELILERQAANGAFEPAFEKGGFSLDHKVPQVVFRPAESGRFRCRLVYRSGGEGVGEAFDHDVRQPTAVDLDVALPGPYVAGVLVDAATGSAVPRRNIVAYYHTKGQLPRARSDGMGYGNLWFPWPAGSSRACETDTSGRFLMLLPRDECPLEVSVRLDEVRVGWARSDALEIGTDDRMTGLRLELRPGGTIDGKVVDASGAPVPGETIAAYDGGANLDRKASDADGTFRFAGLSPGAYAVEALGVIGPEVAHGGVDEVFGEGVLDPAEVFERRVTVREGETTPWTIVLERDRLGAIEGSLGDGLPQKGTVEHHVLVDGQPWEAKGWPGSANVEGRAFRIPNRHAGLYRVSFRAEGIAAEATAEVRRGHVARVVLRPASGRLSIPLPALAPRELEGLEVAAVQRRGRAAPAVEGYHEPWLWEEWSAFRSEVRDGAVVIAGLPGGTWRARVKSPHLADAWSEPAAVHDGLHAEAAALQFPKPCEARVRLELEDGSPLPGDARIEVWGPRGPVSCRIEASEDDPAVRRLSKLPAGDLTAGVRWQERWAQVPLAVREDAVAEARAVVGKP